MDERRAKYRVQALERALDVLDCFSFQSRELSLSEVVSRTGLNKTTAKRLTANLTSRGYLQQDLRSKKYQLGLRLLELGGVVFASFPLRWSAAYPMTRLQGETGGTVLLGVRVEDQLVYIDKRAGNGDLRIASDIGWRRCLHYGMLGMVLMSELPPEEVRRVLKSDPLQAHTPNSITDEEVFVRRLAQIRERGYVLEREEAVSGAIGVAAPIRDYSRRLVAALGVALPAGGLEAKNDLDRLIRLVQTACETVSAELGYLKI